MNFQGAILKLQNMHLLLVQYVNVKNQKEILFLLKLKIINFGHRSLAILV